MPDILKAFWTLLGLAFLFVLIRGKRLQGQAEKTTEVAPPSKKNITPEEKNRLDTDLKILGAITAQLDLRKAHRWGYYGLGYPGIGMLLERTGRPKDSVGMYFRHLYLSANGPTNSCPEVARVPGSILPFNPTMDQMHRNGYDRVAILATTLPIEIAELESIFLRVAQEEANEIRALINRPLPFSPEEVWTEMEEPLKERIEYRRKRPYKPRKKKPNPAPT